MKSTNYQNYKKLMKKIDVSNEVEHYVVVNNRIDEILAHSNKKEETLKSLLFLFESKVNRTAYYSIMSICYAVLLCIITLLPSLFPEDSSETFVETCVLIICLMVIAIFIMIASNVADKAEEKILFVLSVIKEKSEEMKNGKTNQIIQMQEDIEQDNVKENEIIPDSTNRKVYYVTVEPKP